MPSIRVGFSTDLNITGGLTGIGTTNPAARLDVAGQISVEDIASSGGVSTFREYQGFSQVQTKITNNTLIDNGDCGSFGSLSGEIKITGETTVSSGSTVESGKIKTLTVTDRFSVPLGDTNSRDNSPEAGTTRFNADFGTLEFFDGTNWKAVNSYARYHVGAASSTGGGSYTNLGAGRGVLTGGSPVGEQRMEYFNLNTLGNSEYFGDLVHNGRYIHGCCGSETRGIVGGGYDNSESDDSQSDIEYFTIASAGKGIDFGDLDAQHFRNSSACSSSTRGLFFGGGHPSYYDTIEYIQINTLGNAQDFGNQTTSAAVKTAFSSSTRGFSFGGFPAYSPAINVVTIASLGDAIKFGELDRDHHSAAGCANNVRGLFAGGYVPTANFNKGIKYITMASDGNAIDFGNLSVGLNHAGGMATQTRAVFCGGLIASPNTNTNTIDYVNIASSGNPVDFGDLIQPTQRQRGTTDCHGGLGGF